MKVSWKKGIAAVAVSSAIAMCFTTGAFAAETGVKLSVNGETLKSTANHSIEGKTYVDLEAFSKITGVDFTYDASSKTATIKGKQLDIVLNNGKPTAYIREIAQATGATDLRWNATTQTVNIQYKSDLVVYGDVVSRNAGCVLQSRFTVGDAVIFRMKATNPITGELARNAKVQVHLSTGEVLDMHLGAHPPDMPGAEEFWTVAYEVTEDTPKGTLGYFVTAETESSKGQYTPFNVMPSLITIVGNDPAHSTEQPESTEQSK
ncbi:stalk domain-containing protein [Bacillus sp. Marseille-P3661]|uniref:stalk domain-containing protein n=1 Tax=Bacillus sp. Marseille-P3661 TaxID=1936234 RepID=UPI000C838938|nr:hypothetical protein [Bacillus sp. Marseille-P3661]